jgi:site-specific DNA-methyltransferase (adenine-specific)
VYPLYDDAFDLLFLDPPYYKVKMDCDWDRQWGTAAEYLEWIDEHAQHWQRMLKSNGSLFVCASPQMVDSVKAILRKRFHVLNTIRWYKHDGPFLKGVEGYRHYTETWEALIFCEHFNADNAAKDEAGYEYRCQQLLRRVFQIGPLCDKYAVTRKEIGNLIVCDYKNIESAKAQASNWILGKNVPNRIDFGRLKTLLPICGDYDSLRREYENLKIEYENLKIEYENLRRPFCPTREVFKDTWFYDYVESYDGKHPAEKPLVMLRDIILTTTREGATVGDFFMGSGTTLAAAVGLGRDAIVCDVSTHWCEYAKKRIEIPPLFALIEDDPQPEQVMMEGF